MKLNNGTNFVETRESFVRGSEIQLKAACMTIQKIAFFIFIRASQTIQRRRSKVIRSFSHFLSFSRQH